MKKGLKAYFEFTSESPPLPDEIRGREGLFNFVQRFASERNKSGHKFAIVAHARLLT